MIHIYYIFANKEKYVNKTEKRQTRGEQQNNVVYLTAGKKTRVLLTRKRSCYKFVYTRQIYIHVSW